MYKRSFLFLVTIIAALFQHRAANAQIEQETTFRAYIPPAQNLNNELIQEDNNISDINYAHLVKELLNKNFKRFNFMQLRILYANSKHYDPWGYDPARRMQDLAYLIETTENVEKIKSYIEEYKATLESHTANIAVINQAISLSKQNPALGDLPKLLSIKTGLFESVLVSGNGLTLNGAYDVITLDEEILLLKHLNYKLHTTKNYKAGIVHYNIHYVSEKSTDQTYAIFVNTTYPMKKITNETKKLSNPTILSRQ